VSGRGRSFPSCLRDILVRGRLHTLAELRLGFEGGGGTSERVGT
jgi:hypothetical protein